MVSCRKKKRHGHRTFKNDIALFFENLKLKTLWCEPYALNAAPNKTLEKTGFKLIKEYITVPGFISFEQPVKQWKMSYEDFQALSKTNR
jgi:hypothetical protein